MKIYQRIKRLWKLSKKDSKAIEDLLDEQINSLPNEDEKAFFIGQGTEEEYKEFQNEEKFGVKRIFDI